MTDSSHEERIPPQPARRRPRPVGAVAARPDRGARPGAAPRDDHGRRDAARPEVGPRVLLLPRRRPGAREGRRGPPPRRGVPAREVGRRCKLRYAPELHFMPDLLPRAGRPDRGAPEPGAAAGRPGTERKSRDGARFPAARVPLPPGQAGRPDLSRRRRAGPQGDRRLAHRPQRHARSDGDRPAAALRRRRRAAPELLHDDGQVLRGHDPPGPRDRDLRPRGRDASGADRDSTAVTAEAIETRPPKPSGESSCSRRRPTPPRRSGAGSSTRWPARARASPPCPRPSACRSCEFGAIEAACSPSRSPAPPEPTSARSPASSARSSAAAPTWRPCGGPGSACSPPPTR